MPTDSYGGTYRLATEVHRRGRARGRRRRPRPTLGGGPATRDAHGLDRDADEPAPRHRRHRRGRRRRPSPRMRSWSSTTPSPRRGSSSPSPLGADIVVHSTTKYLGGHSDVIGGFVGHQRRRTGRERLGFLQNAAGAVPGPFDCYLVQRGVMTLPAPDGTPLRQRARRGRAAARPRRRAQRSCTPRSPGHRGPRRAPAGRCGRSAAWSASPCAAASRRRSTSAPGPACSPWPRASAASRA